MGGEKASLRRFFFPVQELGRVQPDDRGQRAAASGMQTPKPLLSLHRTLNSLSQTRPLQQHTGLSRTVRRYPATSTNGQLTSNALPSGPGLELRDSTQRGAHVNRLSPPWGKVVLPLDLGEQST